MARYLVTCPGKKKEVKLCPFPGRFWPMQLPVAPRQTCVHQKANPPFSEGTCKARWDTISQGLESETAKFHRMTNSDFSEGLKRHALQQIEFESEKQKHWQELLAEFEQVEGSL